MVLSYSSSGDFIRFNPHFHCIVLEGGIDDDNNFIYIPIKDTSKLTEIFRQRGVQFLQEKKLLNEYLSKQILSWHHFGGFSVNNSVLIHKHNDSARENLCQYIARHLR
jgi:hypothetical protein